MKELKDFEEELYKCSRCGLCQSVCPVYKASLNECAVSKGKFNMLNGVIKGDLSLSKQIKKYLDMCTGCNACKDFCPSSIDAREIIQCAKAEYYRKNRQSFPERFFNSYSFLKMLLVFSKPCFYLYRLFRVDLFVKIFAPLLHSSGEFGKKILLLDFFAKSYGNVKTCMQSKKAEKTLIFFDGCVNKYVNSLTEDSVFKILNSAGYSVIKRNFECCGITFLSDGNISQFKKIIALNLKQLQDDFDYVLTDCASCNDVLKHYKDFTDNNLALKLADNTVSVLELIKDLNFVSNKSLKVSVHVPCHEDFDIAGFVKNIKGLEYIEVPDFDKCCGFSGAFAIKNSSLSKKISIKKTQNYIDSGVDIVLTTCPSCMLGLEQGFIDTRLSSDSHPLVMNLFVFLAKYCSIG